MIVKTIQFEVKKKNREEVVEAIENLTRTVHVSEPGCRLYLSVQDKQDRNRFIHIMAFENEGAEMKHRTAGYTKEFTMLMEKAFKLEPVTKEYIYIEGL